MRIDLTTTKNIKLKTAGKYTEEDIEVSPKLQTKTLMSHEEDQVVNVDEGYAGLKQIKVYGIPRDYVGSEVPRKGETTYTPTTTDQEIASGQYLSGKQVIKGDSNLTPENVAKGTTIFGVTGTHEGGITPEGTLYITTNGIYDVTDKAEVNVDVSVPTNPIDPPVFGFTTFKENGEYNAADYGVDGWSFVKVEVAGSGSENLDAELNAQIAAITELEDAANSLPNAGGGDSTDLDFIKYEDTMTFIRNGTKIPTDEEYEEIIEKGYDILDYVFGG